MMFSSPEAEKRFLEVLERIAAAVERPSMWPLYPYTPLPVPMSHSEPYVAQSSWALETAVGKPTPNDFDVLTGPPR